MRVLLLLFLPFALSYALSSPLRAQDDPESPPAGLVADDVEIQTELDPFGQVIYRAAGTLTNSDSVAYENITLLADVYDAADVLVGEGLGFLVNACGTGLLPGFALQPQRRQSFSLLLELFNDEADIARVEVFAQGRPLDPLPLSSLQSLTGIQSVIRAEVVNVEWLSPASLRFATGCHADVFTNQTWFLYDIEENTRARIIHPATRNVTAELLERLGLDDPVLYNRSYLTYPTNSNRLIFQTPINVILTAAADGTAQRLIYDDLSRRSLHGFIWLPEGRFLAYYYGAYGEEVTYFTASMEGQLISGTIYEVTPSQTIPGPTPDGARAVITTTVDDVTGYYLRQTRFAGTELLFEATPPGNNWPAPIYAQYPTGDVYIYIMRPVDDLPLLQCFDLQTRELNDLTVLPLDLSTEDRAWAWLSPDGEKMALAANGLNGGLWVLDLPTFGLCGQPLQG